MEIYRRGGTKPMNILTKFRLTDYDLMLEVNVNV